MSKSLSIDILKGGDSRWDGAEDEAGFFVYSIGTEMNTTTCMIIALSGLHFDKYPVRKRNKIGASIM